VSSAKCPPDCEVWVDYLLNPIHAKFSVDRGGVEIQFICKHFQGGPASAARSIRT
jgi:hypothetical protein